MQQTSDEAEGGPKVLPRPLTEWRIAMLRRRDLQYPTGEPLYSYRISDEEFASLESLLRGKLTVWLQNVSLGDISVTVPNFPTLFVLYASEWWRRRYDGGAWTWDPIVQALGAEPDDWNQTQRGQCIERGLQDWSLSLGSAHGLRFLGSIAFNGGLPMQLLATARGNIGRVLRRTMQLAATGGANAGEIAGWIESLAVHLPQSYRQREVFSLLADVIVTVLRLRDEARLTSAAGAVSALDSAVPQWRKQFPLPVDDAQAQGLIEQLLQDAIEQKATRPPEHVYVERSLEPLQDGVYRLKSSLVLPEYAESQTVASWFGLEVSALGRALSLVLVRAAQSESVTARRLAGQDRYRIDRRPLDASGRMAAAEHQLRYQLFGGGEASAYVRGALELEADVPWIFDDAGNRAKLIRNGAGPVSPTEVLVAVPSSWSIEGGEGTALKCGVVDNLDRTVYRLRGTGAWGDGLGSRFKVSCGRADAEDEQIELKGARIFGTFMRPMMAFRGPPSLWRASKDAVAKQITGQIAWRCGGGNWIERLPPAAAGVWQVRWTPGGELRWRGRAVVLPPDAFESFRPGDSPMRGVIELHGWKATGAALKTDGVSCNNAVRGSDLILEVLSDRVARTPPEWIECSVHWAGGTETASVRLPFPSSGGRVIDASGKALADSALVPVHRVLGARIVAFFGQSPSGTLEISKVKGANSGGIVRTVRLQPSPGTARLELRLLDFLPEIQRLLAADDDLDSAVCLRLRIGGHMQTEVRIARYDCPLLPERDADTAALPGEVLRHLSIDDLRGVSLEGIRIDAPNEEPLSLPALESEGVPIGRWALGEITRTPGAWLLYPTQASTVFVRPLAWSVSGAGDGTDTLRGALRLSDSQPRRDALAAAVEVLAGDYSHDDWSAVEQLASQLGHLPLTTLDLWRQFAHSATGMAAIALRFGALKFAFIERFALEMPFLWELVPFRVWRDAMERTARQCVAEFGETAATVVIRDHLQERIRTLASVFPGLRVMLESASKTVLCDDKPFVRQTALDTHFQKQLFEGEQSFVQNLMRGHTEDERWPTSFSGEVSLMRDSIEDAVFMSSDLIPHRDSIINAPIVTAIAALKGQSADWLQQPELVGRLRANQAFDAEWFSEAYEITVLRGINRGLVTV